RDPHGARGGRVLRAGVSPRARAGAGGALGGEVHAGRDVLYAPEGRQQGLHVLVRRAAVARGGRDGRAAVPAARGLDAARRGWSRMSWQRWDLHPSVIIGLVLLGGLYVHLGGLRASRRRVASFAGALLVLGLALNGPLHNLSDGYLFSAHMVQHLVLTLVFPPLLLYGTPAWVVRPLLRPRWLYRPARRVTRPLAAGVLFSVPITLWHFPQFYEAALEHHPLHIAQHLVFLATGVLMWWPVLSPTPELPRASYLTQLLYLFTLGLPMSVAGALTTLSHDGLYPFYAAAPRLRGLAPLADQQLAASSCGWAARSTCGWRRAWYGSGGPPERSAVRRRGRCRWRPTGLRISDCGLRIRTLACRRRALPDSTPDHQFRNPQSEIRNFLFPLFRLPQRMQPQRFRDLRMLPPQVESHAVRRDRVADRHVTPGERAEQRLRQDGQHDVEPELEHREGDDDKVERRGGDF